MNEEEIPIDINVKKLLDWLVSRNHIERNWFKAVSLIRDKISSALSDMPAHKELTTLLSGATLDYMSCVKIIEILKETEKDSKNILGWYGSQRMKVWQGIVTDYQRKNVFLAELAQMFSRCVEYDIPNIKKLIESNNQLQEEYDKKVKDLQRSAANAREKYISSCKELGITGSNIREELQTSVQDLSEDLDPIVKEAASLKPACQMYTDFLFSMMPGQNIVCLPLLKFIIEKGNVTTYEWIYGQQPVSIVKPELEKSETLNADELVVSEDIDFNIDSPEEIYEEVTIDWGSTDDVMEDIPKFECIEGSPSDEIVIEESGLDGGIATGNDASLILENVTTQTQFVDELAELESFLQQRLSELSREDNFFSLTQLSLGDDGVPYHTRESLSEHLSYISSILSIISSPAMQHKLSLSSSQKYVDHLAKSLADRLITEQKLLDSAALLTQKKQVAKERQQELSSRLKLLVRRGKELQSCIQSEISKKYKNRPVNLMGVSVLVS